jgi:hypothetical protein
MSKTGLEDNDGVVEKNCSSFKENQILLFNRENWGSTLFYPHFAYTRSVKGKLSCNGQT